MLVNGNIHIHVKNGEQNEKFRFRKSSWVDTPLKDGATLAFCENSFCHNLKTNKVKFIKVYIFIKEIFLNGQIFG